MWLKLIVNRGHVDDRQSRTRTTDHKQQWSVTDNLIHPEEISRTRWRAYALVVALLFVMLWGVAQLASPLYAAMQLNYFDVLVNAEQVILEWSTASENEVLSFEIERKKAGESNSHYYFLGKRIAQGNKDHGAIYRFDIMEGLEPNTAYCFRLREITLNQERGEIIDRCGYGLNITPTPAATATSAVEVTSTLTISLTPAITTTAVVTAAIEQPLFATDTPLPSEPVIPTEPAVEEQPLPEEPLLPMETPLAPTATATNFAESPLVPPIPTTDGPTDSTQSSAAALESQSVPEDTLLSNESIAEMASIPQPEGGSEVDNGAAALANPPYIILTVTPTEEVVALASTFTPFPTAEIDTEPNLVAATLPTTQNMMILLLCAVFSGASGLGILGVVTTLLYMRSRTQESTRR